jgi:hypothetical protein
MALHPLPHLMHTPPPTTRTGPLPSPRASLTHVSACSAKRAAPAPQDHHNFRQRWRCTTHSRVHDPAPVRARMASEVRTRPDRASSAGTCVRLRLVRASSASVSIRRRPTPLWHRSFHAPRQTLRVRARGRSVCAGSVLAEAVSEGCFAEAGVRPRSRVSMSGAGRTRLWMTMKTTKTNTDNRSKLLGKNNNCTHSYADCAGHPSRPPLRRSPLSYPPITVLLTRQSPHPSFPSAYGSHHP